MTDKELLEAYLQGYKEDICGYCSECNTECNTECNSLNTQLSGYKNGFLAGLKTDRLQWHNLRKNPEDLPEQSVLFWDISKKVIGAVEIAPNQYCSMVAYYSFPDKKWKTLEDPYTADVIAWCELPKFEG